MNKQAYIISGVMVLGIIILGYWFFGSSTIYSPEAQEIITVTVTPKVEVVNIGIKESTLSGIPGTTHTPAPSISR